MLTWLTINAESISLTLYIQPGAKLTQISGKHDQALKIRLAAPPIEGKANKALITFLAKKLSIPKNRIQLDSGTLSRHKIVTIQGKFQREEIMQVFDPIAHKASL